MLPLKRSVTESWIAPPRCAIYALEAASAQRLCFDVIWTVPDIGYYSTVRPSAFGRRLSAERGGYRVQREAPPARRYDLLYSSTGAEGPPSGRRAWRIPGTTGSSARLYDPVRRVKCDIYDFPKACANTKGCLVFGRVPHQARQRTNTSRLFVFAHSSIFSQMSLHANAVPTVAHRTAPWSYWRPAQP